MLEITQAIQAAIKNVYDIDCDVVLTRPDEQFGDFACNIALQLSKQLGKNPREIAETLAVKIRDNSTVQGELYAEAENDKSLKCQSHSRPEAIKLVKSVDIAGPGFINITLSDEALLASDSSLLKTRQDSTVVIETNNPNPFKAMHIGHAFNAILADTIANLLESSGATTHRVSYHGDVGAHVGKSMYAILKYVDGDSAKLEAIEPVDRNSFMSQMYAEGAKAYKEDRHAKAAIDELAKQSFTREDPLYAAVYDLCKAWSFEQIDNIVARIGNQPIEQRFLESQADERGVPIVQANVPAVFQESDGALMFKGSEYGAFDNVFVAANGRGLYAARDLGLMVLKNEAFAPDKSYIVTAEEQRDYFKGVIAAAELCMPEYKGVTTNISTGTVKLTTGKMSSRSGDVVEIAWLFDQIGEAVAERGSQPNDDIIAGALRYQFLKVRIGSDVIFDIEEAISLQGNSGPYLQYAHARACSILAKSSHAARKPAELQPDERSLLRKITEYADVYARATDELMPHHICTYLYELAQTFNRFYEHNRVIDDPREAERLYLITSYAQTLKAGLELLGIHAPDKM